MSFVSFPAQFLINAQCDRARPYGPDERAILSIENGRKAWSTIAAWPGYAPTPLLRLAALADETGVGEVLYKDEGRRFGLKSFKALGGAYAVERLARERDPATLTVACATDGNHGRAVAWGAARVGAKAVIYVHETVSPGRADAIARLGAKVVRAGRVYDDTLRLCAQAARQNGWQIVSDTSWPGYEQVPCEVMQGYSVVVGEALEQGAEPTHVFAQGGVGGLAAGLLSWFWEAQGPSRPVFVVVEPDRAACLFASAEAGAFKTIAGDFDTIMAGLACGEPSLVAWKILGPAPMPSWRFPTRPRRAPCATLRPSASSAASPAWRVSPDSGSRRADPAMRAALRLDARSRVLCIGTEGATDPDVYASIVGRRAEEVAMETTA